MEDDAEFRVIVSLEKYFSDERARCYMSAARGRPVRWLARRLRRMFALPRHFVLMSRGHLLPPDEPLALLRPDDPVDVIPTTTEILSVKRDTQDNGIEAADSPPGAKHTLACEDQTDNGTGQPELDNGLREHDTGIWKHETGIEVPKEQQEEPMKAEHSDSQWLKKLEPPTQEQECLLESKRRALQLLDELNPPPPRRRRRRTRRRTPRTTEPADASVLPTLCDSSWLPTPTNSSLLPALSDNDVLSTPNSSVVLELAASSDPERPPSPSRSPHLLEAPRAPRIVHALST